RTPMRESGVNPLLPRNCKRRRSRESDTSRRNKPFAGEEPMKISRLLWLCHISPFVFAASVVAQSSSSISGCIEDSSLAALSSATVTLTESGSAKRSQAQTDEKGCFTFTGISSGRYHVNVIAEGFAPFEKEVAVEGETP